MKNNKLVSVILSTFNSSETISTCIESVLDQTYKNIELLIVDDCSTDNTYEILDDYRKKYPQVKLFKNTKNIGLTKSLNFLINKSKGEFIARQDSDDISYLDRIEKQLNFIYTHKLDGCTTRALKNGISITPRLSYYLPLKIVIKYKNPFVHGTLLIRKSTIDKIKNYDERFYFSQDYKLLTDLLNAGYKISIMKDALYNLNTFNNISSKYKEEQKYYANCVRKKINPQEKITK